MLYQKLYQRITIVYTSSHHWYNNNCTDGVGMLKKLVKYGNSNALIFDKAILELLDIEEGSVLKIKTDGKSLIITPQVKVPSEKVVETFTNDQAFIEATIKESFKRYKDLNKNEQENLEKELKNLYQKHKDLANQLYQNPEFFKEVAQLAQQIDASSPEYIKAYKALRNKFSPELISIEKEITTFESKNKLSVNEKHKPIQNLSEKQQQAMEEEFLAVHKKYNNTYKMNAELLNNPEYQHEAQLIAEKYNFDKNSADYLRAIDELTYKYQPEFQQARQELRAISEKYIYIKVDKK